MSAEDPFLIKIALGNGRELRSSWPLTAERLRDAIPIDERLAVLDELWDVLEEECIAECCGIDAFRFDPESVLHAVPPELRVDVIAALDDLGVYLRTLPVTAVVTSSRLNQLMHRSLLEGLIDHLKRVLQSGAEP